uniref:Uncharacterized protein n=1 Tax=Rhizophora mucronata TaxID=61149 RepID=A0A2P2NB08_RHIMU
MEFFSMTLILKS